jgi:hypothetical protein
VEVTSNPERHDVRGKSRFADFVSLFKTVRRNCVLLAYVFEVFAMSGHLTENRRTRNSKLGFASQISYSNRNFDRESYSN